MNFLLSSHYPLNLLFVAITKMPRSWFVGYLSADGPATNPIGLILKI